MQGRDDLLIRGALQQPQQSFHTMVNVQGPDGKVSTMPSDIAILQQIIELNAAIRHLIAVVSGEAVPSAANDVIGSEGEEGNDER